MTPKEELTNAIQTLPDDAISALLEMLRKLTPQSVEPVEPTKQRVQTERLYRKNGILVAETGWLDEFDTTEFIKQMREERIQKYIDQAGL